MKKATLNLAALIILLGITGTQVSAQSQANSINVVTSAVPFLRISPDARSGGMGDVGIATAPDANSAFWNLAKTPFNVAQGGVVLTYTPWLQDLGLNDVYLASLSGYYKLDELQAISSTLRYFNLGNIQFTDNLGNDLSSFRPREFAFDLGYSRKLSTNLGLGVALRYINSNLASGTINGVSYKAGNAVAGDLSIFHTGIKENGSGWNYGVSLTNLGSKISYTSDATQKDYIPANLGVGIAYNTAFDETSKITFALDVNKLMVPTPPAVGDSAGLVDYRNQGVVSSWFTSFYDAPGGFSEELKEFQLCLGTEFCFQSRIFLRKSF